MTDAEEDIVYQPRRIRFQGVRPMDRWRVKGLEDVVKPRRWAAIDSYLGRGLTCDV